MSLAHWRSLIACGAVLMTLAIGGCASAGISPTPTTKTAVSPSIPTVASVQTPTPFDTPVLGPSTFSGTYIYDARPTFIYYLSITQTGNEVVGFMNIARPDGSGGTKANTVSLSGITDSDIVTLYVNSTNSVYTLSKTKTEDGSFIFTFSYPTDSGQIASQELTPASQYEFNDLLFSWQTALSDEEQVTQDILAKSKKLGEWINHIEQATGSFDDSIGSLQEMLSPGTEFGNFYNEEADIEGIKDELSTVKEKAAIRPMSCSDFESVDYYYESMMFNYDELGKRRGQFAKKVSSLETSLSQVAANITATQDAARVLDEGIQNNPYPSPAGARGPWPGDEKSPISNYQAAADAARKQLPDLKATDAANQKTADTLMAEGKAVLDRAKALVTCPP